MTEMVAGKFVKRSGADFPEALRVHLVHLHRGEVRGHVPTGWEEVDHALGGGLIRGGVHEWIGTTAHAPPSGDVNGGAWSPPVAIVAHLVRQAWQNRPGAIVWIGSMIQPTADILRPTTAAERLLDGEISVRQTDDRLLRSLLLVDVSSPTASDWAFAAEMALAAESAAAVTAVVLPGAGLRMPDLRRLQLAAERARSEAGGPLVLVVRPPEEDAQPSPAVTRWRVCWSLPSVRPAWRIELIKARPPQSARAGGWVVAVSDHDPGRLIPDQGRAATAVAQEGEE